jgi:hypothetical protein
MCRDGVEAAEDILATGVAKIYLIAQSLTQRLLIRACQARIRKQKLFQEKLYIIRKKRSALTSYSDRKRALFFSRTYLQCYWLLALCTDERVSKQGFTVTGTYTKLSGLSQAKSPSRNGFWGEIVIQRRFRTRVISLSEEAAFLQPKADVNRQNLGFLLTPEVGLLMQPSFLGNTQVRYITWAYVSRKVYPRDVAVGDSCGSASWQLS